METTKTAIHPSTKKAAAKSPAFDRLLKARMLTFEQWIEQHASGTLRKSKRIGLKTKSQYMQERIAWEFGYQFEVLPATRVMSGPLISSGDCKAVTELGWHLERMQVRNPFVEDQFEPAYLMAQISTGKHGSNIPRKGLAIVVTRTSVDWIPASSLVFAFISKKKKNGTYSKPKSPF